ncbi:MAG: NAD(P)-dependent oxidoreductase [Aquabacterium sp.]|nr:NAD(P)-dependent oxidoreductase [Aquabacterium sp.]
MKVAVSGASGFVGQHVVAALALQAADITLLVRPGAAVLPALAQHRCVAMDAAAALPDAFDRAGRPDVLIHLAWGGLPQYQSLHHFEQEAAGQYRFLKAMLAGGLRQLLVSGTCAEYGLQSGPLHEDLPTEPVHAYGLAKDQLRRQLQALQRLQPFGLTWARLFYLHGEGQSPGALWPLLRSAAARGDTCFPMSGGEQLRDYLGASDAAHLLVALARSAADCAGGHGVVNVCAGRPVSVRALVEGWIQRHGWAIVPAPGHYPYPDHEPMAFWGDRRKLDRCLAAAPAGNTLAQASSGL